MPTLIIEKAEKTALVGRKIGLPEDTRPTVIGRRAPADIALGDRRASRAHAHLILRHGGWLLEDLESRNGLFFRGADHSWERITRRRLSEGDSFRIGATVLRFSSEYPGPSSGDEILGCRLDRILMNEAGVSKYAAWQLAMDRAVRLDTVVLTPATSATAPITGDGTTGPADEPVDEFRTLGEVVNLTAGLDHAGLGAVVQSRIPTLSRDDDAGDVDADSRRVTVIFGVPEDVELQRGPGTVFEQDFPGRLRCFHLLTRLLLAHGRHGLLRYPVGLQHVAWSRNLEPWLPAFELSAWVADRRRSASHFAAMIPYLAPEQIAPGRRPASDDVSIASRTYNLGAMGYHIMTRSPPMGDAEGEDVLRNHLQRPPAPADALDPDIPEPVTKLLEAMMSKDPASRPSRPREILDILDAAVESSTGIATGNRARGQPAAAPTDAAGPVTASAEHEQEDDVPDESQSWPVGEPKAVQMPEGHADRTSLAVLVPIWVVFWTGLFVATRILTTIMLERFGQ